MAERNRPTLGLSPWALAPRLLCPSAWGGPDRWVAAQEHQPGGSTSSVNRKLHVRAKVGSWKSPFLIISIADLSLGDCGQRRIVNFRCGTQKMKSKSKRYRR